MVLPRLLPLSGAGKVRRLWIALADGTGRPVPAALRSVFLTAREIRMCNKLLEKVRKGPWQGARTPRRGASEHGVAAAPWTSFVAEFRGAEPYMVCPAYHEQPCRLRLCGLSKKRRVVSGLCRSAAIPR